MIKMRRQRGEGTATQRLAMAGSLSHPQTRETTEGGGVWELCRGCLVGAGSTEARIACWSWRLPGEISSLRCHLVQGEERINRFFPPPTQAF